MDTRRFRIRAGLAAATAAVLISGAAWHGLAATPQPSALSAVSSAVAQSRSTAVAGGRDSYADVVKNVAPAVVTIRVEGKATAEAAQFDGDDFFRRFFGGDGDDNPRGRRQQRVIPRTFRQRGLGSGVIVSTDGYILTNNHVVDGADQIHVDLSDGRTLEGKVIGTDKPSDLALIKVTA